MSTEEQKEEKIGFNSGPLNSNDEPDLPVTKKKVKFSNQRKTPLQKASFGVFIAASILSVASFAFFMMPVLSALAGIMAFIIIGLVIIIPILGTVFLILLSEGYRSFVGSAWKVIEWFFDAPNHVSELAPYFPYVAIPALVLDATSIVLCTMTLVKGEKGVVTYLIFSVIYFLTILVVTIIYFANGMIVLH